jgi:hypothetical protein
VQTKPLFSLEPEVGYILSADWSPGRPAVFACGSSDGKLLVYDLLVSVGLLLCCCVAAAAAAAAAAAVFACGSSDGQLLVYDLLVSVGLLLLLLMLRVRQSDGKLLARVLVHVLAHPLLLVALLSLISVSQASKVQPVAVLDASVSKSPILALSFSKKRYV